MKSNFFSSCLSIATATLLVSIASSSAVTPKRTLILLQENSGVSFLNDLLSGPAEQAAQAIVDAAVESSEAAKFQTQIAPRYNRFVNLSDLLCTRSHLLSELIRQTDDGQAVDLVVLGHGSNERLALNKGSLTGGLSGNIRSMLTEARAQRGTAFRFNLRTVYMCNCFGSTLNDDWLRIGAKVAVGSFKNNYMPEPMISAFWNDFALNDKRVIEAASNSYNSTKVLWQFVPGYNTPDPITGLTKIQESRQIVSGDSNLIFKDECLMALNETRTIVVRANRPHDFAGVFLVAGQRYSYSATGTWKNGFFGPTSNANGYTPGVLDSSRRNPSNMMALIGERFKKNGGDALEFINGSGFKIGTLLTQTAPGHGFLKLFANDALLAYGDNTGQVTLTIRRVQ